jgi:hypothetical protein
MHHTNTVSLFITAGGRLVGVVILLASRGGRRFLRFSLSKRAKISERNDLGRCSGQMGLDILPSTIHSESAFIGTTECLRRDRSQDSGGIKQGSEEFVL